MATIVPIVSKKSASSRVKTSSAAATIPILLERAEQAELAEQPEVGDLDDRARPGRDVEAPAGRVDHLARGVGLAADLDDRLDDDRERRWPPTMPMRMAPFTRRISMAMIASRPDDEDEHRPADEEAADAELDRHGPGSACADEAGVDEADEGDEQADADGDGGLELRRDGAEHGLPEAGEHEDRDDEALDDDEAHGVGPGHAGQLGDAERDEGVEPEPGRRARAGSSRRRP